ncbi:uncharacterized protein AMSG_02965 [Thecamonas trahens ATCC 50062]|uniref:inosine/xanthosine triphosphatase n=1 Tax=Thecamonas trahens ATCC 50062 TaxID=461836 RepID=A0A0L0D2H7_THETB|nr:hypothetical protein AMSG_02965 [Thecamonas trahens ATCC 50062]KNC46529.1 hypothetical protein AMSG_02965 [Thecamonas trahens ATCC 50062]|eukprot:XP_013760310.1 hypothetical protein AMSG_02965 [Thecamonas trahens ATCC 50062]
MSAAGKIYVASGSPVKVDDDVVAVKVGSGVAEQPVGHEETRRGASQRAQAVLDSLDDDAIGVVVSLENGVVEMLPGEWFDLCWVLVVDIATRSESWAHSAGVKVPVKHVDAARAVGFSRTVGSFLAEETACDPQDPHAMLSNGAIGRGELLLQAVVLALGTYAWA